MPPVAEIVTAPHPDHPNLPGRPPPSWTIDCQPPGDENGRNLQREFEHVENQSIMWINKPTQLNWTSSL